MYTMASYICPGRCSITKTFGLWSIQIFLSHHLGNLVLFLGLHTFTPKSLGGRSKKNKNKMVSGRLSVTDYCLDSWKLKNNNKGTKSMLLCVCSMMSDTDCFIFSMQAGKKIVKVNFIAGSLKADANLKCFFFVLSNAIFCGRRVCKP